MEPEKAPRKLVVLVALILSIIGLALLISGLASRHLFSATQNGQRVNSTALNFDSDPPLWMAAGSFFIISGMLEALSCIVLVFSIRALSLVYYAQTLLSAANIFSVAGFCFLLFGIPSLDDPCTSSRTNNCGLQCEPGTSFAFFQLCPPFELDTGAFLLIAAIFTSLLAALTEVLLRLPYSVVDKNPSK
eukprot:gene8251-839_t